jgi:ornithine cyclodeaminase
MAVAEGHLSAEDVVPMARIATGVVAVARDRPRVVKTCGMGWQDLAVASAAIDPGPEA